MEHLSFKYFFFFVHWFTDRHFDSEPGTKRHNIWYPVKSYYRRCVWTGKRSQSHLGTGLDREGRWKEHGRKPKPIPFTTMKMEVGMRILCFKSFNYQEAMKTSLASISLKQHIQNASKFPNVCTSQEGQLTETLSYCWKTLKFMVACSLVKGNIILIYCNHSTSHFKKKLKRVSRGMFDTILLIFNFNGKIEPFP